MAGIEIEREEPMNLDASSSQELKRPVLAPQADEDLTALHVIPEAPPHPVRSQSHLRELLLQPFGEMQM